MSRRQRPQAIRAQEADDGLPRPWAVVLAVLSGVLLLLGSLVYARWAGM
jgi:hypothetical protein